MASPQQLANLKELYIAAFNSDHIWPAMAACEACLETGWLTSELGRDYHNLFGTKLSLDASNPYQQVRMKTREYIGPRNPTEEDTANERNWAEPWQTFVWYPAKTEAFTERMKLLERLQGTYPEYREALHADTPEAYVLSVSRRWSTDPLRGQKVLEIYNAHKSLFEA